MKVNDVITEDNYEGDGEGIDSLDDFDLDSADSGYDDDEVSKYSDELDSLGIEDEPEEKPKEIASLHDLASGNWIKVDSSVVSRMKYNFDENVLVVDFNTGAQYGYHQVSTKDLYDLYNAESVGSHLNTVFKSKHPYKRYA